MDLGSWIRPEFDTLIDGARQEFDWARRFDLLARAMTMAVRSRAMIPLVARHHAHGARKGLVFRAEPRGFPRFADLTPAPR